MLKLKIPQLVKSRNLYISKKDEILSLWLSYNEPKLILKEHSIDGDFFKKEFSAGVFDYFMGIISGEVEIGNCPIMQKLMVYLKNREISADELFEICSHFRRAMISFSYDIGLNSKELFDEISFIFDKNFRGILKYYTDTIFQKLIDARQEALQAGIAKEYFLSNMSHEIRTPLNAILGFVNLLLDDAISPTHREYLDIISQSGENLLSIINDILDFSKLRSGEFTIEPKIFSIYVELSHTIELFIASARDKHISLKYNFSQNIPSECYGDILRIKQILSNLLSNAIKFTPERGKVEVEVSFVDAKLIIVVRDNGIGIAKDEIKNIFNPFVQVNHYELHKSSGTGLGLSISHQLLELMGGDVRLKSKLGKGSEFTLNIPMVVHNKKPYDIENYKSRTHKKMIDVNFIGHVLIAEDNEANQELIKILLSKYGLSFDLAQNGLEAFEMFKSKEFDLVLMDEQMPIMDGNEAVRNILEYEKQNSKWHTPITAVTANVIKGDKERGLLSGFDSFLGKPIILKDLERVLLTYLQVDSKEKEKATLDTQEENKVSGVDIKMLKKELMLNMEELKLLLNLFIQKMEKLIPDLHNAILEKDYKKISFIAHSIKGSSGNFRLDTLQSQASQMEKMAKKQDLEYDYEAVYVMMKARIDEISIS